MRLPNYIPVDAINQKEIKHEWDDWDPYEVIGLPDEATKLKLIKVTNRAMFVFTLGCIEWVVYRFSNNIGRDISFDYIEAFWVYLMGIENALPPETTETDKWEGPIYGPINLALATFYSSIYISESGPPVDNSALSSTLAMHVLVRKEPFLEWKSQVLDRLISYCAKTALDAKADIIPREILDPQYSLEKIIENRYKLASLLLEDIDFETNIFLKRVTK